MKILLLCISEFKFYLGFWFEIPRRFHEGSWKFCILELKLFEPSFLWKLFEPNSLYFSYIFPSWPAEYILHFRIKTFWANFPLIIFYLFLHTSYVYVYVYINIFVLCIIVCNKCLIYFVLIIYIWFVYALQKCRFFSALLNKACKCLKGIPTYIMKRKGS